MGFKNHVATLHRYYIWADLMRNNLDHILESGNSLDYDTIEGILSFAYIAYWHASMYVVEGWKELGLRDEKIDSLLQSKNVDLLRRYRNGVFHFQKGYFDKRFFELYESDKEAVEWIRTISDEFAWYFLDWTRKEANIPSEVTWKDITIEYIKRRGRPSGRPEEKK